MRKLCEENYDIQLSNLCHTTYCVPFQKYEFFYIHSKLYHIVCQRGSCLLLIFCKYCSDIHGCYFNILITLLFANMKILLYTKQLCHKFTFSCQKGPCLSRQLHLLLVLLRYSWLLLQQSFCSVVRLYVRYVY